MFVTTENLDSQRVEIINSFNESSTAVLPIDYAEFVKKYGAGTFCDEISIGYPDAENIPRTFNDYRHLWTLDESFTEMDLLNAVQLGLSNDGDYICVTKQRKGKVFVLPRHSDTVEVFDAFFAAVKSLLPKTDFKYFDPLFSRQSEQINLIKNSKLVDIMPIHEAFLVEFSYDLAIAEDTQPKYFIKNIGGWIYFDLIYKNSINVKFQKMYADKAQTIIDFLRKYVE